MWFFGRDVHGQTGRIWDRFCWKSGVLCGFSIIRHYSSRLGDSTIFGGVWELRLFLALKSLLFLSRVSSFVVRDCTNYCLWMHIFEPFIIQAYLFIQLLLIYCSWFDIRYSLCLGAVYWFERPVFWWHSDARNPAINYWMDASQVWFPVGSQGQCRKKFSLQT